MARLFFVRTLCTLSICFISALAHMQMSNPSPLRDPHGNGTGPKDYNMLTPLSPDGSNFACKGYQWNTPLTPVATYNAGQTYNMSLIGSATHGGGSCQISLSCDNGIHFKAIKSIIGGCPLQKSYSFTIPQNAKSGKCLLAWTWMNKIGNREYYMDCAAVNINGGSASSSSAAQDALSDLPDIFVANLAGINSCKTKETTDPVFPQPGKDVEYGDGLSASSQANTGITGSRCIGAGHSSAPSGSASGMGSGSGSNSGSSGSYSDSGSGSGSSGSDSSSSGSNGSSDGTACNDGQWHPACYGSLASSGPKSGGQQPSNSKQGAASGAGSQRSSPSRMAAAPSSNSDNSYPIDDSDGSSSSGDDSADSSPQRKASQAAAPSDASPSALPSDISADAMDDMDGMADVGSDGASDSGDDVDATSTDDGIAAVSTDSSTDLPDDSSTPSYSDVDADMGDDQADDSLDRQQKQPFHANVDDNSFVRQGLVETRDEPPPATALSVNSVMQSEFNWPTATGGPARKATVEVTPLPVAAASSLVPAINLDSALDLGDTSTDVLASLDISTAAASSAGATSTLVSPADLAAPTEAGTLDLPTGLFSAPIVLESVAEPTLMMADPNPLAIPPPGLTALDFTVPTIEPNSATQTVLPDIDIPTLTNTLPVVPNLSAALSFVPDVDTTAPPSLQDFIVPPKHSILNPAASLAATDLAQLVSQEGDGVDSGDEGESSGAEITSVDAATQLVAQRLDATASTSLASKKAPRVSVVSDDAEYDSANESSNKAHWVADAPGQYPDSGAPVSDIAASLAVQPTNVVLDSFVPNREAAVTPILRQAAAVSTCTNVSPLTVYVRPPAAWYAQHSPPASFAGTPGVDAPADCVNPLWSCGGCSSPDRCVRINRCTRSCTRLPYTSFSLGSAATSVNMGAAASTTGAQGGAANAASSGLSAVGPPFQGTPTGVPGLLPPLPTGFRPPFGNPPPNPPPNQFRPRPSGPRLLPGNPPVNPAPNPPSNPPSSPPANPPPNSPASCPSAPYAGDNPGLYMPCKPGTFLCKSATQFYTCGQYGQTDNNGWTYGALRDVAAGMQCKTQLTAGSPSKKKRQDDNSTDQSVPESDNMDNMSAGDDGKDATGTSGDVPTWFPNSPPVFLPGDNPDAQVSALPIKYFLGPGPVIPEGSNIDMPEPQVEGDVADPDQDQDQDAGQDENADTSQNDNTDAGQDENEDVADVGSDALADDTGEGQDIVKRQGVCPPVGSSAVPAGYYRDDQYAAA